MWRVAMALLLVAVTGIGFTLSFGEEPTTQKKKPVQGTAIDDFSLVDHNGKKHKLSDYDLVVLEWTEPKCPYVVRHLNAGTMTGLSKKYKDKGVAWFGVMSNRGGNAEMMKAYAEKNGIEYPILLDTDGKVGKAFKAKTTPHMFIVKKEGKKLLKVYEGGIDDDRFGKNENRKNYVDQALTELLAGKTISEAVTTPYG